MAPMHDASICTAKFSDAVRVAATVQMRECGTERLLQAGLAQPSNFAAEVVQACLCAAPTDLCRRQCHIRTVVIDMKPYRYAVRTEQSKRRVPGGEAQRWGITGSV